MGKTNNESSVEMAHLLDAVQIQQLAEDVELGSARGALDEFHDPVAARVAALRHEFLHHGVVESHHRAPSDGCPVVRSWW